MTFTPIPGQRVEGYDLTQRLDTDFYAVFSDIPHADRAAWDRAKTFADEIIPVIDEYWDRGEYNLDFARRMGELDLFTDGIDHDGITHLSPLAAGPRQHGGIARGRVDGHDSRGAGRPGPAHPRAVRQRRAEGEVSRSRRRRRGAGTFALTEPDHGSDSVSLETEAVQIGDEWVLNGAKKWIGNGASGGITFVWAECRPRTAGARSACFLVEQDTPGYSGRPILRKASLRAIHQAHITLTDVRLPLDAVLPGSTDVQGCLDRPAATRSGVAWSALGHATACYESALTYAKQRVQFGKPLAGFQMVQERLTQMLAELTGMQLSCRQLADLEQAGRLLPDPGLAREVSQHPRARDGSPLSLATCSAATASSSRTT